MHGSVIEEGQFSEAVDCTSDGADGCNFEVLWDGEETDGTTGVSVEVGDTVLRVV